MPLDTPVVNFTRCEIPHHEAVRTNKCLGLELEYEQVNLSSSPVPRDYWDVTSDGSLRNGGVEFISRPLLFEETDAALMALQRCTEAMGAVATERCGLHVHLNMRTFTVGQLWSLFAIYALMEPTIFATYAEDREDSMFALPLWKNHAQQRAMQRDIAVLRNGRLSEGEDICEIVSCCKYTAMNTSSLYRFGTVEMRQPYCTTEYDAILSWVDFLKRMVNMAETYDDPIHVLDRYEREGVYSFQEDLIGTTVGVTADDMEAAEDAAYLISGYDEPEWTDIEWDTPIMEAV